MLQEAFKEIKKKLLLTSPKRIRDVEALEVVVFDVLRGIGVEDPSISAEGVVFRQFEEYLFIPTSYSIGDGGIVYNTEGNLERKDDKRVIKVDLSLTENKFLWLLVQNPRMILTHKLICENVWNGYSKATSHLVKKYVQRLRRKLDPEGTKPENSIIKTIPNMGYRLSVPTSKIEDTPLDQ